MHARPAEPTARSPCTGAALLPLLGWPQKRAWLQPARVVRFWVPATHVHTNGAMPEAQQLPGSSTRAGHSINGVPA